MAPAIETADALLTSPVVSPETGAVDSTRGDTSILEILTTLAHYKRTILKWAFAGLVIVGGYGFLRKPYFTASVTLLPPQQNSSSSSILAQLGNLSALGGGGGLGLKNPTDMYVALMESASVQEAMVRRYHLDSEYKTKRMSDTRKMLDSLVHIEANPKDGLIRLALTDENAERAAELANGYVAQYQALTSTLAVGEAAQRRLFFQQQLEAEKDKLAAAEEDLKRTEQNTGVVQLDSQARALIQESATLRAQITAKEVQLASLRTYAANSNAELLQTEQELSALRSQLARIEAGGKSDTDLNVTQKLPQVGLEYIRKTREVKYNETLFEILARQFEVAKLDEAKEGALIQVVDPATVPDRRSGPKRLYFLAGGLFGGLFIGCMVAMYRAAKKRNPLMAARIVALRQALKG